MVQDFKMINFHKHIYLIGEQLRNPSLSSIYKELKNCENLSIDELRVLQLQRLKELVNFTYAHSDFYKRKMDKIGLKPNDIKTLKDISKIPILTKQDLLQYNLEIHTTKKYAFKKLFKANTSGTTGDALSFYKDEYADSFNRASIARGYSWYNVKPWDFSGYFWGFNFNFFQKIKTRFFDYLVNRFRLFSYKEKDLIFFVKKIKKAKYIEGYSSMIFQTAKLINNKVLPKPKSIKMVKGTSEKIYHSYQDEVKKAFGSKMISEYGAAETGIIAFECSAGNMHINMEGVIIEQADDEIIVTNLIMKSFPILRYKLGDYIVLEHSNYKCSCGLNHPVIKEVTGRVGKNVYGYKNIYPSLYFYYIFKNLDKNKQLKLTYQIIQKERGKLDFNISEKLSKSEKKILSNEIIKYFGNDVEFNINDDADLFKDKNQKLKSFISYVK